MKKYITSSFDYDKWLYSQVDKYYDVPDYLDCGYEYSFDVVVTDEEILIDDVKLEPLYTDDGEEVYDEDSIKDKIIDEMIDTYPYIWDNPGVYHVNITLSAEYLTMMEENEDGKFDVLDRDSIQPLEAYNIDIKKVK